jgi:hypothetical protein
MSSEVKTILRDRLKQNYEAYIAGLQGKSTSELIDLASEITAAKQVCEELPDACDEDTAAFLLQSDNPLEAVLGSWESELTGYDHSEEMRHMLWELHDKELHAGELCVEEKTERKGCAMQQITTDDLRKMRGQEGLILQGCGGELQEWVDGINDLLTEAGILLNASVFETESVSSFQHDGVTCLLFPFEGVELDMGRLAMWRLQTHGQFGGTWLSDYVPNRLGGFIQGEQSSGRVRPLCPLIGQNGNIYNLVGIAAATLKENGMETEAKEMTERIMGGECHSYDAALAILTEYVQPTDILTEPQKSQKKKGKSAYER